MATNERSTTLMELQDSTAMSSQHLEASQSLLVHAKSLGEVQHSDEQSGVADEQVNTATSSPRKRQKAGNNGMVTIEIGAPLTSSDSTKNQLSRKKSNAAAVNVYKQYRNLTTVNQVWEEFTIGFNGNPSVLRLEELYGWSWRRNFTDQNWFYQTRKIYDLVSELVLKGKNSTEAVKEVDEFRETNDWSLQQLENNMYRINIDNSSKLVLKNKIDHYKQYRNLTTVNQVWQEYTQGLYGNPSMMSLNEEYGHKWRFTSSDRRFYYRRKRIYDFIENLTKTNGKTVADAIDMLESFRITNGLDLESLQCSLVSVYLDTNGNVQMNSTFGDYKQFRNLTTVKQVWQEYKKGIYGNPSVQSLEKDYGNKWRVTPPDANWFYARKKIYDKIEDLMRNGTSEDSAVDLLDSLMRKNSWTLSYLQKIMTKVTDTEFDSIVLKTESPPITKLKQRGTENSVPIYKQVRFLYTIQEIWQEYTVGLRGHPSIISLDEKYGSKWRDSDTDRQFYNARRKIYTAIKELIADGISEQEAVDRLNAYYIPSRWDPKKLPTFVNEIIQNHHNGTQEATSQVQIN